jgi:hypothetical protein
MAYRLESSAVEAMTFVVEDTTTLRRGARAAIETVPDDES